MHASDEDEIDEQAEGDEPARGKAALSPNLSGKQRRFLRALGHHLKAVLQIGREGVTDAVVKQALVQLQAHELIKVKASEGAPDGRHGSAEKLAAATGSELAQVLGRTFLIFKKRKKQSKIDLP